MSKTKKFTWADLKKVIDKLSPAELKMEVTWWGDERGGKVQNAYQLEEDYVCTDYGCEPASVQEYSEGDEPYPVVFPKGTPIISVD